jgi:hypothetical protein
MFRTALHFCAVTFDRADYLITLARLSLLDRFAGPMPETPQRRISAVKARSVREAFPAVAIDSPTTELAKRSSALGSAEDHIDASRSALSAD